MVSQRRGRGHTRVTCTWPAGKGGRASHALRHLAGSAACCQLPAASCQLPAACAGIGELPDARRGVQVELLRRVCTAVPKPALVLLWEVRQLPRRCHYHHPTVLAAHRRQPRRRQRGRDRRHQVEPRVLLRDGGRPGLAGRSRAVCMSCKKKSVRRGEGACSRAVACGW